MLKDWSNSTHKPYFRGKDLHGRRSSKGADPQAHRNELSDAVNEQAALPLPSPRPIHPDIN
jgi:hypothetical protein